MIAALTCRQVRELDQIAIEKVGIPGIVLMENAARGVAQFVHAALVNQQAERVVILCGPGNNGGDGYAAARHLLIAGVNVTCICSVRQDQIRGDAAVNLGILKRLNGAIIDASGLDVPSDAAAQIAGAGLIVDALLGTGASGPPREPMAALIRLANAASHARRIAVDLPTGLDADSGLVHEPCFLADATVTFVAEKVGFASSTARRVLGRVVVVDIGVPPTLLAGLLREPQSASGMCGR